MAKKRSTKVLDVFGEMKQLLGMAKKKKKTAKKAAKKTKAKPKAKPAKKAAKKVVKKKVAKKVAKKKVAKKVAKKVVKKSVAKKVAPKAKAPIPAKEKISKKAKKSKAEAQGQVQSAAPEVEEEILDIDDEELDEDEEVILTDAEGRRYCRTTNCDQLAVVDGYCRYHYLLYWKKIQVRKKILSEGKLENYIEELTSRYPDKYLEMLRKDLKSEKEFLSAIQELEIDDSESGNDSDFEEESFIEEVRGVSDSGSVRDEDEY